MAISEPRRLSTMSFEEFLAWSDEDTHAEWVDGSVTMASPASLSHQLMGSFLQAVLKLYVEQHGLGLVLPPPFLMKLGNVSREPDLLYVSAGHLHRFKNTYLDGPADLVVEIVSPDSVQRDHVDKYKEYQAGGVAEYWLIDPGLHQAEFYRRDDRGLYQPTPLDRDGVYRSAVVPGFWLHVDWLWQQPLPAVLTVLHEIDPSGSQ